MKKLLYIFLACCLCHNALAETGGVTPNQHVKSMLIPRTILEKVIRQDADLSKTPGAIDKMLAKYDQLAGPLGQEPLTVNDITQICVASDVITRKDDCLNRVFNPVLAEMGKIRFIDVCTGKISGGTPHCVDDVFIKSEKQNANPYHQDVNVSPYTAFGFAIEYAKRNGHDVWCSAEIIGNTVKCTTLDNKDFYSIKFNGTNNTTDMTIEKNLVKGICALFDSKYAMGTWRYQCKMNCGPGTEARSVIQKFGLDVFDRFTSDMHCEIYQPTYTSKDVKTYPGYEYMSLAFKNIQSVLDSSLIETLKSYVILQGINVQSFDCDYSTKIYSDEMPSGPYEGMPISLDDMLQCRINGTDVDFIFDDLFESKEYGQKAGKAALQCVLAGGNFGPDNTCRGLKRDECLSKKVQKMVPGGTRWDPTAEVCLLNSAEKVRDISNALQIGSGVVLAIVFTPLGMPYVGLAAVGLSLITDLAFIGLERLEILEPASRAHQFATDAQKCAIPVDSVYPSCSQDQNSCAWHVIYTHAARLDEILDLLNSDQLSLIDELWENVANCLSPELFNSAVNMSTLNRGDKTLNQASMFLLIGSILVTPEKLVTKLGKMPRLTRGLARCGVKLLDSTDDMLRNGTRFHRIAINNFDTVDDLNKFKKGLEGKGYFYGIDIDQHTGRQFLLISQENIFSPRYILDNLNQSTGIVWEYKSATESGLGFGHYRVDISKMEKSNISTLKNELYNAGIMSDVQDTNKGTFLIIREENIGIGDIRRLGYIGHGNSILDTLNQSTGITWEYKSASESGLGVNHYRINISNKSEKEIQNLKNTLSKNGFDGQFEVIDTNKGLLLVVYENPNARRTTNIFDKIYNDTPADILQQKLEYVYTHSATNADAIAALKRVGAFDETVAQELALDIANETVLRIRNNGGQETINKMKNWSKLSKQERTDLAYELHEYVTTIRRDHIGNTRVDIIDEPGSGHYGLHMAPGPNWSRKFEYNIGRNTPEELLTTIIHENTHALQSIDKSSIHPYFTKWGFKHYVQPEVNFDLYFDNIVEIEARYIGENAAHRVMQSLGL